MFIKLLILKILIKLDDIGFNSLGSKFILRADKKILYKLLEILKGQLILITGTNGKTTVKFLLKDILNKEDKKIVINDHSRNDCYGILYALIKNISLFNKRKFDYIIFEVKDLDVLDYFNNKNPDYMIITNLFKDQIIRKYDFKNYINNFKKKIEEFKKTTFILNGDDPAVTYVSKDLKNEKRYYGIDNSDMEDEVLPGTLKCLCCEGNLKYTHRFFGQLGEYNCENCDFDKPGIDYLATNTSLKNGIYFDLLVRGDEYPFDLPAEGLYNIYNILAAISLIEETDIGLESVELALEKIELEDNFIDSFYIKKPIFLKEATNINSFEQIIEDIEEDEKIVDILLIHDEKEDYSNFIYSLDIDILKEEKINKIYITGIKGYDIALALKAMGISLKKIVVDTDVDMILNIALSGKGNKLYIINMDEEGREIGKQLHRLERKWSIKHNG